MTEAGRAYRRKDNGFTWVEDRAAAQRRLDQQLTTDGAALRDGGAAESHPGLSRLVAPPGPYYWSVPEGEYATDLAFRAPEDLRRLDPRRVRSATGPLRGADGLRFRGDRTTRSGEPRRDPAGEVVSTIEELVEGTCAKHRVRQDGLKRSDKFGPVLRPETLLIDVRDFKVFRMREGSTEGPMQYLRSREGVADRHRRAAVGARINERSAEARAKVAEATPLGESARELGRPTTGKGRSVRALHPLAAADVELLEAIHRGEFLISGFRDRDLRARLFAGAASASPKEAQRRSAKVTRLIRLLRAHGLITKVPKTHRCQVSAEGRRRVSAPRAARQASTEQWLKAA
jgi:hypothetical protein